jgi:hypothetical protein
LPGRPATHLRHIAQDLLQSRLESHNQRAIRLAGWGRPKTAVSQHYRLGALPPLGSVGFSPKTSLFSFVSGGGTIAGSPVFHSGQLATRRAVFSTSLQYSAPVLTRNSRGIDIAVMLILFERKN